jgi:hypothetical protein
LVSMTPPVILANFAAAEGIVNSLTSPANLPLMYRILKANPSLRLNISSCLTSSG